MFQLAQPLFLTCETPLHAGSGDSLGIVDMPIQRERHTSFPKIEASSLKGALRESFEDKFLKENPKRDHPDVLKAFGPDESSSEYAGALGFTDARLLLFPVKSMRGVFAWITSPQILRQFSSDLKLSINSELSGIKNVADGKASPISINNGLEINNKFVLEEYTFEKVEEVKIKVEVKTGEVKTETQTPEMNTEDTSFTNWLSDNLFEKGSFWNEKVKHDILILSDNDFKDFVNLSTEVITRTNIDNKTGTVQKGALFTEEYLPAESVMYSLVLASPEFVSNKGRNKRESSEQQDNKEAKTNKKNAEEIMKFFSDNLQQVFQLGGNATLGKGILKTKIISSTKNKHNA